MQGDAGYGTNRWDTAAFANATDKEKFSRLMVSAAAKAVGGPSRPTSTVMSNIYSKGVAVFDADGIQFLLLSELAVFPGATCRRNSCCMTSSLLCTYTAALAVVHGSALGCCLGNWSWLSLVLLLW